MVCDALLVKDMLATIDWLRLLVKQISEADIAHIFFLLFFQFQLVDLLVFFLDLLNYFPVEFFLLHLLLPNLHLFLLFHLLNQLHALSILIVCLPELVMYLQPACFIIINLYCAGEELRLLVFKYLSSQHILVLQLILGHENFVLVFGLVVGLELIAGFGIFAAAIVALDGGNCFGVIQALKLENLRPVLFRRLGGGSAFFGNPLFLSVVASRWTRRPALLGALSLFLSRGFLLFTALHVCGILGLDIFLDDQVRALAALSLLRESGPLLALAV